MSERRLAALERRVSELESQNRNLRRRMERMLSRSGGHVKGQVHIEGWLQVESQSLASTPAADMVRIQAIEAGGGFLQLVAQFPTGHVEVLGQE